MNNQSKPSFEIQQYLDLCRRMLQRMRQDGAYTELRKRWRPEASEEPKPKSDTPDQGSLF